MSNAILIAAMIATTPGGWIDNDLEFLGFSKDGHLAAFKESIAHHHDDNVDRFELIRVVDTESGGLARTFRDGVIRRTRSNGRAVRATAAELMSANPPWEGASPRAEWVSLKRRSRLSKKLLDMSGGAIRIQPDGDLRLAADSSKERILLFNRRGTAIGYHAIVKQWNGNLVNLGHFRDEGLGGATSQARVQLYFSKDGARLALVNRFTIQDGGHERLVSVPRVVTLREFPIASTQIGRMRLTGHNLRQNQAHYKNLHPQYGKLYDKYVGRYGL